MSVENFKLFQKFSADFNLNKFVVFDGPNGYGKTSFYDAIELFFTGKIRRYDELAKLAMDGREAFDKSPFLNDRSKQGDLIIKMELEINGENKILMRKGERKELEGKTRISEASFKMYELENFDTSKGKLVEKESEYLAGIFGQNYLENFQFLHYIEQEENIILLKNKDKDRRNAISYLFNTVDFESRLEKIKAVIAKISELCGKEEKDVLEDFKKEILVLEKEISGETKDAQYVKLIDWSNFDWDAKEVDFKDGRFADLIGEGGILERLKELILNINEFKKKRDNEKIDQVFKKEDQMKQMLLYYNLLDSVDGYTDKLKKRQEVERIKKEYDKGVLKAILGKRVELDNISDILLDKIDIKMYSSAQKSILKLHEAMNMLSGVVASLKDSRNSFVQNFYKYENVVGENKECPMCGFEWPSVEELKLKIQKQEEKVSLLSKETGKDLDSSLEKFEHDFVVPLQSFFQSYLDENKVDDIFVKGLQEAAKNKDEIKKLHVEIESHSIQVKKYISDRTTVAIEQNMAALKKEIEGKKHPIDDKKIQSYFMDYFIKYFNQKEDLLKKITPEDLKKKKEYLMWKYSIYQSGVLKSKRQELEKRCSRYEGALDLKNRLTALKKTYENSLNTYQQKIIGDIEILFHIYSGRIIQDSQGGMGLFISDKNGIRFLEDPKKNHDAVFTMSSGQLAVLIIAFTLTLNKRYSENKMLFIDDPVQTLDELNISSLVELLRNEFSDRQIFLSTHEDKMSAYMRYKFEKFGLKTGRLSFRERYLNSKV